MKITSLKKYLQGEVIRKIISRNVKLKTSLEIKKNISFLSNFI